MKKLNTQLYHLVMVRSIDHLFAFFSNKIFSFIGRSLYISKSLNKGNWEIFQSRRVHFGLLGKNFT